MNTKRRKLTSEFKASSARLVLEENMTRTKVAKDLGISINLISKWVNEFQAKGSEAFPVQKIVFLLMMFLVACTSYHEEPLNGWLRLYSARSTTLIPHLWEVGDSWTRVEFNSDGETWKTLSSDLRENIWIYGFDDQKFAVAVVLRSNARTLSLYFPSGEIRKLNVGEFFMAVPNAFSRTITILDINSRIDAPLSELSQGIREFDLKGRQLSSVALPQNSTGPKSLLRIMGHCSKGRVIFKDSTGNLWEVENSVFMSFKQDDCSVMRRASCISSTEGCGYY
jgi:hypothetical protein